MNELIKFGLLAAVILLAMSAISKLSRWFAEKLDLNQKVVGYVVAFIVFLICSALWNFTPVYDYISQITGFPWLSNGRVHGPSTGQQPISV